MLRTTTTEQSSLVLEPQTTTRRLFERALVKLLERDDKRLAEAAQRGWKALGSKPRRRKQR